MNASQYLAYRNSVGITYLNVTYATAKYISPTYVPDVHGVCRCLNKY